MRKYSILAALLIVTACDGGLQSLDAQKFLATLDGPKVPTIQDTMLANAKDAEKKGDFKQAAQIYQQQLEKQPDNKEVILALADCYRRSGDYDHAIPLYDHLLEIDDKNLGAKEGKSLALMAKGDYETPGKLLGEVMQADPTRWKTLNALGILFTTRNMNPEAQQYFNEALKHSPSNTSVMNNLGLSQALDRKYEPAIATLTQASSLTAADSLDRKRIDLNLALVYAIAGKLDDANAIAGSYFTGPALENNLGLYAHLAKDNQLAKAYLNMALTDSKTFYEKAWDNLQSIDSTSSSATKPAAKKKDAPAAKSKPQATEDGDEDEEQPAKKTTKKGK